MYADDTTIIAQHRQLNTAVQNLQTATNEIGAWFSTWKLVLKPQKLEAKIFTLQRYVAPQKIIINNTDVE